MHLLRCNRPMLHTLRHDEQLSRRERDAAVAQLDGHMPLDHIEEVVGVVVLVPHELAIELGHHDIMAVELRDGARLKVLGEGRELFF